jgi:hypothetical protein
MIIVYDSASYIRLNVMNIACITQFNLLPHGYNVNDLTRHDQYRVINLDIDTFAPAQLSARIMLTMS